jgi:hypothetical protein
VSAELAKYPPHIQQLLLDLAPIIDRMARNLARREGEKGEDQ